MMEVNKKKAGEIVSLRSQEQSSLVLLGFKVVVFFVLYLTAFIFFYTRAEYTPLYQGAIVLDAFLVTTLFYTVICFPISLLMFSKSRLISNISTIILSWFCVISSYTLLVMYENYCAKKDYLIELGIFSLRRFVRFGEKRMCITDFFKAHNFPIDEAFIIECAKHCKTLSACKESALEYILFCKEKEIAASVTSFTQLLVFTGVGFVAGAAFFLFSGYGGPSVVPQIKPLTIGIQFESKQLMEALYIGFKSQTILIEKVAKSIYSNFHLINYEMDALRLTLSGFEHLLLTHWSPII